MEGKLNCLRCGAEMELLRQESIQLGRYGVFTGHWSNLWAGGIYATIMVCPNCGKLEFFSGERPEEDDGEPEGAIAQAPCPRCGVAYEMDFPKCPFCGEKNPNW